MALIVQETVPGSRVTFSGDVGPDVRNYRVSCDKIADRLGFCVEWTVERGARQVLETFSHTGLSLEQLTGPAMQRLPRIKQLLADGRVGKDLRWLAPASSTARG